MVAFSWVNIKKQAVAIQIAEAKIKARTNIQAQIKRPQETVDAKQGKYTTLIKRVTDETLRRQAKAMERRNKLVRKN